MSICQLVKSAHSLGEFNAHLILTPAYRRDIFCDLQVSELTAAYLMQQAQDLGVRIAAIEFGTDHVHLFIENWRRYAPAKLVQLFKGYVSYQMRKGHKYLFEGKLWGDKFWSSGYFFRTVGAVSSDTVKRYITESQTKHWKTDTQQVLLKY